MDERTLAWVVAAQRGDVRAWAPLADEFLPTALGAAYAYSRDWELAHDHAQETFAFAIDRIRELREPAAFPGWLLAIARSCASRERRARAHVPLPPETPSPDAPDAALARSEEHARVRRAVEALRESECLPVVLHYYAGLSLAAIAELCALPLSSVKKRMRVARARLREEGAVVKGELLRESLAPSEHASAVLRLFCATRAGDLAGVADLLARWPALVDARERFSPQEQHAHRLGFGGGTPLLRAIERGDEAMTALLLERGADPNGACGCAGGEAPLWTAVVHGRAALAERLLRAGADPNRAAFEGATPLHVAALRGQREIADVLRAHGADASARDRAGRTPAECAQGDAAAFAPANGPVWWTGIRALDLWCPLPQRGLVRWSAPAGVGSAVLLGELAWRAAREGRRVLWAGFAAAPLDAGDLAHGLAELGVADRVTLAVPPPDAARAAQVDALAAALASAADALLVLFEAAGFLTEIEQRLGELAARPRLTLVVAPIGMATPTPATGTPYLAAVAFDPARAQRGQWPAIAADGSWSRICDPQLAAIAARARRVLARGGEPASALQAWLSQPFFCAEPFSGRRGEWTSWEALAAQLGPLVGERAEAASVAKP